MVYILCKDRTTDERKIFNFPSRAAAKVAIENNWDKYGLIAIFEGDRLDFSISYEDAEETVINKKPKVDIS